MASASQKRTQRTLVDASIEDLSSALQSGHNSAVDLVAKLLLRISTYDCRSHGCNRPALNSIPLLNPDIFAEAEASDDRRAAGQPCDALDGIPFTVKDSYKVKGMTVASGSEAFKDLVANEDAFTVGVLRKAGAVLVGKTNMCPMAFGGMLRGVYGRAESPYSSDGLAAAFASGSSNGSGASTAASFAAFGMGEETVSSGRSPASNNALVAYTPSRGLISIRGNWPLYPTCDVVVPHTRSMEDLVAILGTLTTEDQRTDGDFWRDQPFVHLPNIQKEFRSSLSTVKQSNFLRGKRIVVPEVYIGTSRECTESSVYTSDETRHLWQKARAELEASGAVVETCSDFPAVTVYEDASRWAANLTDDAKLPDDWNATERGRLIAHGWNDFLRFNKDPNIPSLKAADWRQLFPQLPDDNVQKRFSEVKNAVQWSKLASYAEEDAQNNSTENVKSKMYNVANLEKAVKALEAMRKTLFDDWLTKHNYEFVIFPAAGDVGHARADVDLDKAEHAWKNGVKYSNGNRALRHLGIPSVTVPMGVLESKQMPMGLTFLGRAYNDIDILRAGYAFEQRTQKRTSPPLTKSLPSDCWDVDNVVDLTTQRPQITIDKCMASGTGGNKVQVTIEGAVTFPKSFENSKIEPNIEVYIDAVKMSDNGLNAPRDSDERKVVLSEAWSVSPPPAQDQRNEVVGKVARDSIMIIVLARNGARGRPSGWLKLIHRDDILK